MDVKQDNVILRMTGITKCFPGTLALDKVQLTCEKGKVHILLGENGAGKSTLMKIISGVYTRDEGTVWYDGQEVNFTNVRQSMEAGISMIHQELNLLPERTIAQNIYLGHEPMVKGLKGVIDYKKMVKDSRELMDRLGLDLDPNILVKKLSIAQMQMVEVVKALSKEVKLVIMDEPTSSLTDREIDKLFEIVEKLKRDNVAIIYISHRMDEIKRIGDCVTVMRDGQYIDTVDVEDMDLDTLISMMVGRKIENMYERHYREPGKVIFETKDLSGWRFRNVNINVREGEIVSLSGLIGAGRTEIAKAVFGDEPIEHGSYTLYGKQITRTTPVKSVRNSMGYLSEDRKAEGLVLQMPIKENLVAASLTKVFKGGVLRSGPEDEIGKKYVAELRIATPNAEKLVGELSGGNQQKVVIGKWLETGCKFLIIDEPTRGIDVGAKSEIYKLLDRLVGEGYGILMISSEMNEVIGISDRVYVMKDGEITGEVTRENMTQEAIMRFAVGGKERAVNE
ncbi:Ribose import ATP-binding protein RbsA [uncultured Butyricicoccus sp.]|nr:MULTISPECIES: sugar ABC transporter ATP-binding protein [Butyricicoccaceae]MCU6790193.1 sugar ABC transporter ATP-binding protein [Agathobaculum ammoniilyticum]WOC75806.1 sugar ABC transporter ATP-binding protein [Intestinibacillus sp. NTUH-41-i26]SCJ53683.1 Ribose import ATP-binding protein RbsA [uncultured Butyricicoccus sp.]